jgi:hypothetical protein
VAGTKVIVGVNEDGSYATKNIEDIEVGDWVLSRNEYDSFGLAELRQVTAVEEHTVYDLQILSVRDEETGEVEALRATAEPVFWVEGRGWTRAADLGAGDRGANPDGTFAVVVGNEYEYHPAGLTVYNFSVYGDHTYFVDDGAGAVVPVWVHNSCGPWNQVGGHHPISKAALRDATGYAWRKAFCAPDRLLKRLGVDHRIISAAQTRIYAALRRSGVKPTLLRIAKAELEAMKQAGMRVGVARALVRRALADLRRVGVTGPFRFPGS